MIAAVARARGFTLVELVVAFAIAALAVTAVLRAVGAGARHQRAAVARLQAVAHAESLLAQLGTAIAVQPGVQQGRIGDGYRWEIRIDPTGPARGGGGREAGRLAPVAVALRVAWRDGTAERAYRVETLRVAPTAR